MRQIFLDTALPRQLGLDEYANWHDWIITHEYAHIVHLGTMGVYGYGTAGLKIPEGYLEVIVRTESGDEVRQEMASDG